MAVRAPIWTRYERARRAREFLRTRIPLQRTVTRVSLERALRRQQRNLSGQVALNAGAKGDSYSQLLRCPTIVNLDIVASAGVDVIGDLHALPVQPGSADVVLMTEVLEHLREPWRAVAECHRVLRPGGVLVLTTRFLYPYHADPHDYYRFTGDGLRYLMREFDDVEIEALGNRFHVVWSALTAVPVVGRLFRPLNPLFAYVKARRTRWADGYLAVARRAPSGDFTSR